MFESIVEHIIEWQKDKNLDQMPYSHFDEMLNIIEEVCETYLKDRAYARKIALEIHNSAEFLGSSSDKVDAYFDICVYAIGAMMKLGYDPIKVFEEGLKEINERTGAYDPQVGKWVKQPKKQNAYKANYENARL